MRVGASAGHDGYFHETAFYGSDDEFVAIVVPFLTQGVEAGEPSVVACGATNEKLIRSAMRDCSAVGFLSGADQYATPATAIKAYRDMLAGYVAAGAHQVRVVGEVPHPGLGSPWDWWARYESAINHAYEDFPLWGLCPYDTRITPEHVLADVTRTHPRIATADGEHLVNSAYESDHTLLTRPAPDPMESGPPLVSLVDPEPRAARAAIRASAPRTSLGAAEIEDMVIAASEAVTNALAHGVAPVRFRLWAAADRMVVTVTDRGTGPADPLAGLVPMRESASAGLGLWLTHQICGYVGLDRAADHYTIRLVVGAPRFG